MIIGHGVLDFLERRDEQRYADAAKEQYKFLMERAKRNSDGGIAFHTGPAELWVGSNYMNSPFLARYGEINEIPEAIDEAAEQIEIHVKRLQDPHSGLFRHSWRDTPNTFIDSSFWGRANGWAATGLVDTLRYIPDDHPKRQSIVSTFQELCSSVLDYQEEMGMWYNILDFPDTKLEASGTLQFIYAFNTGRELGILEGEEYTEAAQRAMDVCKGLVDNDGNVRRVAVPPDKTAPLGVTSYGQGMFLLAATSMSA
jgi:unsaturated rhamnogalacturonyl hydrolase